MNTISRIALALILLFVGMAPGRAQNSILDSLSLDDFATYFNMAAPVDMGSVGILEKIEYDKANKLFIYFLDYDDSMITISQVKENLKVNGSSLLGTMINENSAPMFRKLVDEGVTLQMRYQGRNSGETAVQSITPHEMRLAMLDTRDPKVKAQQNYDAQIGILKRSLPINAANGITMTDIYDETGYMVFEFQLNEENFKIVQTNMKSPEMRKNILTGFSQDPATRILLGIMDTLDKGLIYRYKDGKNGRAVDMTFPSYELKMYK